MTREASRDRRRFASTASDLLHVAVVQTRSHVIHCRRGFWLPLKEARNFYYATCFHYTTSIEWLTKEESKIISRSGCNVFARMETCETTFDRLTLTLTWRSSEEKKKLKFFFVLFRLQTIHVRIYWRLTSGWTDIPTWTIWRKSFRMRLSPISSSNLHR